MKCVLSRVSSNGTPLPMRVSQINTDGDPWCAPRSSSNGPAFVQNLRRGHYELGLDTEPGRRLKVVFTELALAI